MIESVLNFSVIATFDRYIVSTSTGSAESFCATILWDRTANGLVSKAYSSVHSCVSNFITCVYLHPQIHSVQRPVTTPHSLVQMVMSCFLPNRLTEIEPIP